MSPTRALAPCVAVVLLLLASCAPTRRLKEGDLLMNGNTVRVLDDRAVDKSALGSIIKQKPNKRILGYRFYLQAWNIPDPERIARMRPGREEEQDRRNAGRKAAGKRTRPYRNSFHEWLRDAVGEAPVILDTALVERSRAQLELYLHKEGWFDATVTDTILRARHRLFSRKPGKPYKQPKARVVYSVSAGTPWHLRSVAARVDDGAMQAILNADSADQELRPGDRFSAEALDRERTRTADLFKEEGYLYFTRDLVWFDAPMDDSTRTIDLVRSLERTGPRNQRHLSGTPQGSVQRIRRVTVDMSRKPDGWVAAPPDTVEMEGYRFLYSGERPEFKPNKLLSVLFLQPTEIYRLSRHDRTYRRLTNLRVFDRVDIRYDSTSTGTPGWVDAHIDLIPSDRQWVSLDPVATNRGGALGASVSFGYRHRNLFRSMASLQLQMNLGLEAQRKILGTSEEASTALGQDFLFNTLEFGPEITVRFPYFLKPWRSNKRESRSAAPRTNLTLLYNYQRRPEFTRTLGRVSLGYEWEESRYNTVLVGGELNVVSIPLVSDRFADYIDATNDPVLRDSYTDHMILNFPHIVLTRSTTGKRKSGSFFGRATIYLAGSVVNWVQELGRDWHPLSTDPYWNPPLTSDSTGDHFTLFNVRYAEYFKLDVDLRLFRSLHERSAIACRFSAGFAKPYGNLSVMPFETSFFVGGANGLRAWRARSVGPGSYGAPLLAYDRIGEIRLEGNVEYRFDLVGYLEGALFLDAGNIWLLNEDPQRPGSGFEFDDFVQEIAIGSGIGLRFNFDFFIIRFDLGVQMRDPALPNDQRWFWKEKDPGYETRFAEKLNLNLGIGYPF